MALIHELPMPEYKTFVLMLTMLPKFNVKTLEQAFTTEHTNRNKICTPEASLCVSHKPLQPSRPAQPVHRQPHPNRSPSETWTPPEYQPQQFIPPQRQYPQQFIPQPQSGPQQQYPQQPVPPQSPQPSQPQQGTTYAAVNPPDPQHKGPQQAQLGQTPDANLAATIQANFATPTEFAGNASTSNSGSTPFISTDWNTDTGATAHMTPHCHWFKSYTPFRVPICLADESIIYSAIIGTVHFVPVVSGRRRKAIEFARVLHVPDLRNNMLSVFYLSKREGYIVTVDRNQVFFHQSGTIMFTVTIDNANTGLLDGHVLPPGEVASAASTCPMDATLWHCCFCHRNHADVQKVICEDLVTGLVIKKKTSPDPICEPCLAGVQSHAPIPQVATFRPTEQGELI